MRAPRNLQILAISSGLTESQVVELWRQAREQSLSTAGDRSQPRHDRQTRKVMVRLIEDKATADVPFNLVPWVLFDLHIGMAIVRARIAIQRIGEQALQLADHLRCKHAA
jgi:hypothetical protein